MKQLIMAFCLILSLCLSACGTFSYKSSRSISIQGEPGTDFYLTNQKKSKHIVNEKATNALEIYKPKKKIVCIGSTDENGNGILKLSTKEYRKSKKWVYAVKEGYEPTRFRLRRKFNSLMLVDIIYPLAFFFDHASILDKNQKYHVSLNPDSKLYVAEIEDKEKMLRKQKRKEKWDRILNNMENIGTVLIAAGQVLEGNVPTEFPVVDVNGSNYTYSSSNNVDNSELTAEKNKLQQLYAERERILKMQSAHRSNVSKAGSKQTRKAGTSLKLNHGQVRAGQGNYGHGAAERGAKTSSDLKVELRNVNKRIETCKSRIRMLEKGEEAGSTKNSTTTSKLQTGADVYHRNQADNTYRNWEGQLINMKSNWSTQYNDSQRKSIQEQMRNLRIKNNLQKSSWEDWDGSL